MNLERVFVSFQDFVGKTRNFSAGVVARFSREEGYIEHGILDLRGNLTLKICSLVNCYSPVGTEHCIFRTVTYSWMGGIRRRE